MRIYIDTQGTIVGNVAGHSLQDCLQAAHDLGDVATVAIMSGDPVGASEQLGGAVVLDKMEVFGWRDAMAGCMVVDDDPLVLASAIRAGACAIPVAMLLELADAMVPERLQRATFELGCQAMTDLCAPWPPGGGGR